MRIRRSASRLLGSAYSAAAAPPPDAPAPFELLTLPPPPPPHLAPCSAQLESRCGDGFANPATAFWEPCELSRSPWDLNDDLSFSDTQMETDLLDKYFVAYQASWLFSASMPAASKKKKKKPAMAAAGEDSTRPQNEVAKKVPKKAPASKQKDKKEGEATKKANVKKEEGAAQVWKCKKNDGKKWHCHRTVSRPNSLCKYHFEKKRPKLKPETVAVAAPAVPKPPTSSKPRKKSGNEFNATEGLYYYTGFGPFRSKRHCRSTATPDSVPPKQEAQEDLPEDASPEDQAQAQADDDTIRVAANDDVSSCDDIAGIAGGDEDLGGLGTSGRSTNGNGDPRGSYGDGKRETPWKPWRKPVKARSLKSLM